MQRNGGFIAVLNKTIVKYSEHLKYIGIQLVCCAGKMK